MPDTAPIAPAPSTPATADAPSPEAVAALALCPTHHRFGSAGMLIRPDGSRHSISTPLVPCPLHERQAFQVVEALREAGLLTSP